MDEETINSTNDTLRLLERQKLFFVDKFGFFSDLKKVFEFGSTFSSKSSPNQHSVGLPMNQANEDNSTWNTLKAISSLKEFSDTASDGTSKDNDEPPHFNVQFEFMRSVAHRLDLQIKIYSVFANQLTSRKIGIKGFPKLRVFMNDKVEFTVLLKMSSNFQESNPKCSHENLSRVPRCAKLQNSKTKEGFQPLQVLFGEQGDDQGRKSLSKSEFPKHKKDTSCFKDGDISVSEATTEASSGELKESVTHSLFARSK